MFQKIRYTLLISTFILVLLPISVSATINYKKFNPPIVLGLKVSQMGSYGDVGAYTYVRWSSSLKKFAYDGYVIYRSEKSGSLGEKIAKVQKNIGIFLDTKIYTGHTYYYTVGYYRGNFEGGFGKRTSINIVAPKNKMPSTTTPESSSHAVAQTCLSAKPLVINPNTSYLIISRKKFIDTLQSFIDHKNKVDHETVGYFDVEDIMCGMSGRDVPEQIRNFLKMTVAQSSARYLLIVGTPVHRSDDFSVFASKESSNVKKLYFDWDVPVRYVEGIDDNDIPTDQYYASLEGEWDRNNNGKWAESNGRNYHDFEFSLKPNLYVGRVPVKTTEQLQNWIQKTISWQPPTAPVESEFLSAACVNKEGSQDSNGRPIDFSPYNNLETVKFHGCRTDSGGDIAALANQDGANFISTYSHGNYNGVLKATDFNGLLGPKGAQYGYVLNKQSPGFNRPPVLFVHGCEVGGLDYSEESLGEYLIGKQDGATAVIASSRSHQDIRFDFWDEIFFHHRYNLGEAVYEYKYRKLQDNSLSDGEIKNFFMFNVLGDPALVMVRPQVEIFTDQEIDFSNLSTQMINIKIRNNTDQTTIGALANTQKENVTPLLSSVSIASKSEQTFSTNILNPFIENSIFGKYPAHLQKFWFTPTTQTQSVAGSETLVYSNFALSCARVVHNADGSATVTVIAKRFLNQDVNFTAEVTPAHFIDEKTPPTVVLRQKINFSLDNQITVPLAKSLAAVPSQYTSGERSAYFPLGDFRVYSVSDGSLLANCRIGL